MTVNVSLKEFFRTGEFGQIKLGMERQAVERLLGEPDFFIHGIFDDHSSYMTANIWSYAGMEFRFGLHDKLSDDILHPDNLDHFMFRPGYLWRRQDKQATVKLNRWIFRSIRGPSKEAFCNALRNEQMEFTDSGMFKVCFTNDHKLVAMPLHASHEPVATPDVDSVVITHVGHEVIFDEEDFIERVLYGSSWEHIKNWREMAGPLPNIERVS